MSKYDLRRESDIFILVMKNGENRFNRSFIDAINKILDQVEQSSGPAALVTIGEGKFYSTGLDLDWMAGDGAREGNKFIDDVDKLLTRILTFPMITAAAINGHAFGAGAIIAIAHDYRVMRSDRGFFCLPEIDLGLEFTAVMNAIIMSRLHGSALRDITLTGSRFHAEDVKKMGIIDDYVIEGEVLNRAISYIADLTNKDRSTMRAIKKMHNKSILDNVNRS